MAIQWNFVRVRPKLVSSVTDGGGLALGSALIQYKVVSRLKCVLSTIRQPLK